VLKELSAAFARRPEGERRVALARPAFVQVVTPRLEIRARKARRARLAVLGVVER
jgi:hypothetical protein